MNTSYIISATDEDIGKTVVSAMLVQALGYNYWKPIQTGIGDGGVDTRRVQKMTGLPDERFLPESYVFAEAVSPHLAAELDGVSLDLNCINLPQSDNPLIIEGAGGLMVPLTRDNLYINQFKKWDVPLILCARTGLGTINHTLLSLEALWSRNINVHGVIFVGEPNDDNIQTIADFSKVRILGHMPWISDLDAAGLHNCFKRNFRLQDFIDLR
ncbi:MAG: dethiobiotin synthase [Alphaproteobacteria bacterium]|nr:dethiobiotin synthase [Alphaproteobacteria bacterium]|tara:strand:+ start:10561 stop:11199 length:639 start_codon:yes stop_codon:yes gene_type:complete